MKSRCAVVLAVAVLLAGCGESESSEPSSVATIESGKLIACTDVPYEPFEFEEDGKMKGIDVDLVKEVGDEMNLDVQFRGTDFDSIFQVMAENKCDLVASAVSITDERKANYLFSDAYFEVNQSLMVRRADAATLKDLPSLAGKKVGVQKGTTGADYATAHSSGAAIVEFEDASKMTDALKNKEIDGVVQDFPINSYLSQKSSDFSVVKTFTDVAREQYGFAMLKTSVPLKDAVNKALTKARSDGSYDKILERYLGPAVL